MTRKKVILFSGAMGIAIGFVAAGFLAAQAAAVDSITFPVAELGNCKDKQSCKTYCDRTENIKACVAFADRHGLIKPEERKKAEKFSEALESGAGPGGCTTARQCRATCEDTARAEECLNFAEKHQLLDAKELAEIKKYSSILKSGKPPGNCTTRESCYSFCEKKENVKVCLDFAKEQGLVKPEEAEQAEKFAPLMERGETPGGCSSKEACEQYCGQDSHREECLRFAEKIGLLSGKDLEVLKKTAATGPGGCRSKEQCEQFCNAKENQEACLVFGREHNLIKPEEEQAIKEGSGRVRMGLSQAPGEVVACLKERFGANIVGRLESGQFTPDAAAAVKVKECFEQNLPKVKEKMEQKFRVSSDVEQCLEKTVGREALEQMKSTGAPPAPEVADRMRLCFEKNDRHRDDFQKDDGPDGDRQSDSAGSGQHSLDDEASRNRKMKECASRKLGREVAEKLEKKQIEVNDKLKAVMNECVREFEADHKPKEEDGDREGLHKGRQMMPQQRSCLELKVGKEAFDRFAAGELPKDNSKLEAAMRECARASSVPATGPQGDKPYPERSSPSWRPTEPTPQTKTFPPGAISPPAYPQQSPPPIRTAPPATSPPSSSTRPPESSYQPRPFAGSATPVPSPVPQQRYDGSSGGTSVPYPSTGDYRAPAPATPPPAVKGVSTQEQPHIFVRFFRWLFGG